MPSLVILGGTGFVSGTLARVARERQWDVTLVTRGRRPLPAGVTALTADRDDPADFAAAVRAGAPAGGWDLVVDCIGMLPAHARQDLAVFTRLARHLVFISSDSVFDPARRSFPQSEDGFFLSDGYGGNKRAFELELIAAGTRDLPWTILRPGHIYGPGSQLGCLPRHVRDAGLLDKLRRGEPLRLVEGGRFLQQPVFSEDIARVILATAGNSHAVGAIAQVPGRDLVASSHYYQLIANHLGVPLRIEEETVEDCLQSDPGLAGFCCHRMPTADALLAAHLPMPATPIQDGLGLHIAAMTAAIDSCPLPKSKVSANPISS
jgi:nucleoside-diphosphate-sugar epimerase